MIIFYSNENDQYNQDFSISTNGYNLKVIQNKDNEICFAEFNGGNANIKFFDFIKKKIIAKINDISITGFIHDIFW